MPRTHLFLIPAIFFLGLLVGAMLVRLRADGAVRRAAPRPPHRLVAGAFVLFVMVFAATHTTSLGAGAAFVEATVQGQPLLDKLPSFTAQEVHARLEGFGAEGRSAYRRFTFTWDVVFPASLLLLLLATARWVSAWPDASPALRRAMPWVPIAWFASDMVENAILYELLSQFPRDDLRLAGILGNVTLAKFGLLALSIAIPAVVAAGRSPARRRVGARPAGAKSTRAGTDT